MEIVLAQDQSQKSSNGSGKKGDLSGHDPGSMQVYDPHIRSKGFFLRTKESQQGDHSNGDRKIKKGSFGFSHGANCTRFQSHLSCTFY